MEREATRGFAQFGPLANEVMEEDAEGESASNSYVLYAVYNITSGSGLPDHNIDEAYYERHWLIYLEARSRRGEGMGLGGSCKLRCMLG